MAKECGGWQKGQEENGESQRMRNNVVWGKLEKVLRMEQAKGWEDEKGERLLKKGGWERLENEEERNMGRMDWGQKKA